LKEKISLIQASHVKGYLGILKAIEAYLIANPSEYA
jgi:hypothetical protein